MSVHPSSSDSRARRRAAEREAWRQRKRRNLWLRRGLALSVVVLPIAVVAAALTGGSSHRHAPPSARIARAPVAPSTPPPKKPVHTAPPPGTLPQTQVFPSTQTAQFHTEMAALWKGVVTGASRPAMAAFFPEAAYRQVKAIYSAQTDWSERLARNFALDLEAAHAIVGSQAELVRVDVASSHGHWVPPGTCYNDVGYYEMPNARLVYRSGGAIRSIGIASMISWRGVWYVVHMGSVNGGGVVDDPEIGPGTPVPSGTC